MPVVLTPINWAAFVAKKSPREISWFNLPSLTLICRHNLITHLGMVCHSGLGINKEIRSEVWFAVQILLLE